MAAKHTKINVSGTVQKVAASSHAGKLATPSRMVIAGKIF
jgi:hypothetical protein